MQIGTIQELLQKFFGLCRCGGAFYTFVPQTAKGWQLVLLGTNCQPFFVTYAALQGHLVVRRPGRNCPTQPPSAAQRYNTLDFLSMKVVCHETPARFLWILSAAVPIVTAKAWPSLLAVPCFLFSCCSRFYSSEGLSSKPKMAVTRAATTMSTAMAMAIAHIVCCKMSSARMVE